MAEQKRTKAGYDFSSTVDAMQKTFQAQHEQIMVEQKKIFEEYKNYFGNMMSKIEEQQQEILAIVAEREKEEEEARLKEEADKEKEEEKKKEDERSGIVKEIEGIRALLDEAVRSCSMEIPEIIAQLLTLQRQATKDGVTKD